MVQFLRKVRLLPNLRRAGSYIETGSRGHECETVLPNGAKPADTTVEGAFSPIDEGDVDGGTNEAYREDSPTRFSSSPGLLKPAPFRIRSSVIWAISLGVWTFLSLAATLTIYQMYRVTGNGARLGMVAGMEFSQMLSYLPLTPFAFALAIRYPIQRKNWVKPVLVHLAAGLVFTLGHITLRGFTPYGFWDSKAREWAFTFWNTHSHTFRFPWQILKSAFFASVVDDVASTYLPIVFIAHALLYSHNSQQKELRALHLSTQLAKARLQVLKNQIQPHFLFNTLHSISALMLTNVVAADRMMTYLSDLLRMSLEDKGNQLTTLNRDLEFLSVYLEIEKTRFEEKLRVAFEVEPECLDAQVPHLFLQPLVENAVRHGTSKRSQLGEINVTAKRREEKLEIWIQDNGPGLVDPAEDLFKRGLGLSVTRERLEALYGSEQECKIRNIEAGGAEVYVCLPFSLTPDLGPMDAEHRYT
jgi:two-component system, LytTR family, sensor kinase